MIAFRYTCFAAAMLAAAPAAADLTARQVWSDWQTYIDIFGMDLSGTESFEDGVLTVADARVTGSFMADVVSVTALLGDIRFDEAEDGSVAVILPPEIELRTVLEANPVQQMTTITMYRLNGLDIRATGDHSPTVYTYAASRITGDSRVTMPAGAPSTAQSTTFEILDLRGENIVEQTDQRRITTALTARGMDYTSQLEDARDGMSISVNVAATDMEMTGEASLPTKWQTQTDLVALAAAGMTLKSGFKAAASSTSMTIRGTDEMDLITTSGPILGGFGFGPDGMSYEIAQETTAIELIADFLPVPASFNIENVGVGIVSPIAPSETPGDFGLSLTLDDFTMSDAVWAMFDPQGGLPRTPARILLDLSGKARLFFDLLNPDLETLNAPGFVPAKLKSLDINQLDIAAVGARLEGQGSFEFETPAGPAAAPRPHGTIDLTLTGANALLDRLVNLGLLPDDDAMGARMMMGLVGVPGEEEDMLRSTIEINEDFQIFANGQRIQ